MENLISIVCVLVIGSLLYVQRNLRSCAKEDTDEADTLSYNNRQRALGLAVAGGFDPQHPERGGGIHQLAMASGETRAMVESGVRPAEVYGLSQASAKVEQLKLQARADRRLANWLVFVAIAIGVVRLFLLLIG